MLRLVKEEVVYGAQYYLILTFENDLYVIKKTYFEGSSS
jgi:hypothetical protein